MRCVKTIKLDTKLCLAMFLKNNDHIQVRELLLKLKTKLH